MIGHFEVSGPSMGLVSSGHFIGIKISWATQFIKYPMILLDIRGLGLDRVQRRLSAAIVTPKGDRGYPRDPAIFCI